MTRILLPKGILIPLAGLLLALALSTTLYAVASSVSITGGSLTPTTPAVTFDAVTLTGADQTASIASPPTWTVVDARGTGAGWNVTINATDFTSGAKTIDISVADQLLQVATTNITTTAGNGTPTTATGSATTVPTNPAAALKILSAATDAGMGTYTFQPAFTLGIPAETYVSTGTYSSTFTVTTASGP